MDNPSLPKSINLGVYEELVSPFTCFVSLLFDQLKSMLA